MELKPNQIYRHFKGKNYVILFIAIQTETREELVIYYEESKPELVFARPKEMFLGTKILNRKEVKRFELIN